MRRGFQAVLLAEIAAVGARKICLSVSLSRICSTRATASLSRLPTSFSRTHQRSAPAFDTRYFSFVARSTVAVRRDTTFFIPPFSFRPNRTRCLSIRLMDIHIIARVHYSYSVIASTSAYSTARDYFRLKFRSSRTVACSVLALTLSPSILVKK